MTGTRMEGQMGFPAMSPTPPPSGLATTEPGLLLCVQDGKSTEEPHQGLCGRVGRQSS